eukprot:7029613-Alexandrium_andersonii.AAC.1
MDAASGLSSLLWKVVKVMFDAGDSEEVKKLLGIVRTPLVVQGKFFTVTHSQAEYFEAVFRDGQLPQKIREARVVTSAGQSVRGPRKADLGKAPCPSWVR